MSLKEEERTQKDTQGEDSHVETEEQTGVTLLQAKEHPGPPETGKGFFPRVF